MHFTVSRTPLQHENILLSLWHGILSLSARTLLGGGILCLLKERGVWYTIKVSLGIEEVERVQVLLIPVLHTPS